MSDAPIPQSRPESPSAPAATCGYCKAELDPAYYFCRACATPYKPLHTLVGRTRPMPLTFKERMKGRAPAAWPMFWTYFTVLVGGAILLYGLLDAPIPIAMLVMDIALAIVTLYFAIAHFATLRPQLAKLGFGHPAAWIGLAALPVALGVNWLWSEFLQSISSREMTDVVQELRGEGLSSVVLFFSIAVFPAICEEIAFRGLLQTWLEAALGFRNALLLASALFAAVHFSFLGAPYIFALGLLLGWVRAKSGSLYPVMLMHFLHNWVVLIWSGI